VEGRLAANLRRSGASHNRIEAWKPMWVR